MTVDDALAAVLERLSDGQVLALASHCEAVVGAPSFTSLAQTMLGAPPASTDAVAGLCAAWSTSDRLSGPGVALALRIGLTARRTTASRQARPVWTGPGEEGEGRLTPGVLHELLSRARDRILFVSFAAYTLPEVAADLAAAVARGCSVDVVFETKDDAAGGYDGPGAPFSNVAGINRWRWPLEQRDHGALLHAKLLVIDGRLALVGSANLTAKALHHNLEVGVLVNDASVAASLEEHIRRLMEARTLVPDTIGIVDGGTPFE